MSTSSPAVASSSRSSVVPAPDGVKTHPPWLGGVAAMLAVTITHPIDQTKMRSQVQRVPLPSLPSLASAAASSSSSSSSSSTFASSTSSSALPTASLSTSAAGRPPVQRLGMIGTARQTLLSSGVTGLWAGLTGSWLRQATYGSTRFGVYGWLKERDERAEKAGLRKKGGRGRLVRNGAIAGVAAGLVGAPAELVMVRMSTDGVKPPSARFNYSNALQGLYRIAKDQGLSSTFRGWGMTCTRSVIMNASQLSCYDMIKSFLLSSGYFRDAPPLHLVTATSAGTVAVTLCAPVDVFKSRIQNSAKPGLNALTLITTSLRTEGPSVLFRGWLPAWCRMTPTTCLTFMFYEQLKRVF